MLNIYINTWGNYNEHGADGGKWFALPMSEDELIEAMDELAEAMGDHDPEFFVNDYEWVGEVTPNVNIGEHDNILDLNAKLEEIDGFDEYEQKALCAILEAWSNDLDQAIRVVSRGNFTFYEGMTLEEVAEEIVSECYLPNTAKNSDIEFFARYFDYEAFARDLGFDGYTETEWGVICE